MAKKMKEHPIIFSTEMVKAILDGRKTQTRRVIKPQPNSKNILNLGDYQLIWNGATQQMERKAKCPYGKVGDRLWVRETWYQAPEGIYYKDKHFWNEKFINNIKWKPSIHMPRWASRITLKITDVRVERLQEIDRYNLDKEGLHSNIDSTMWTGNGKEWGITKESAFIFLWNSIHKKQHRWEDNPFVWVISFRRI